MTSPYQQPGPGGYGEQPPGAGEDGEYGTSLPRYSGGGGYGDPVPQQQPTKAPLVLSIIGIITWFIFPIAGIVLGLLAQSQYRKSGQRDTLAKVAWIGGIVSLVVGIVAIFLRSKGVHTHTG